MLTKEKILFLVALVVAAFTLTGISFPAIEPPPEVPNPESARTYRAVAAVPDLSPEDELSFERDPFATKDPWQPAAPATLPGPPGRAWPRALPGGPPQIRGPQERRSVGALPRPATPPPGEGQ